MMIAPGFNVQSNDTYSMPTLNMIQIRRWSFQDSHRVASERIRLLETLTAAMSLGSAFSVYKSDYRNWRLEGVSLLL
jgi:hypothetical protein